MSVRKDRPGYIERLINSMATVRPEPRRRMRISHGVVQVELAYPKRWFDRSDYIETLDYRSELTTSGPGWAHHERGLPAGLQNKNGDS